MKNLLKKNLAIGLLLSAITIAAQTHEKKIYSTNHRSKTVSSNSLATQLLPTQDNGVKWYDTTKKVIDAHAQCFIKVGDTYYMFGENRINSQNNNFYAFNCYKSTDCVNWEFVREVLTAADIGLTTVGTRATVIYNEKTQKYVMYFKSKTAERKYGIATCSTVDGKYDFVERRYTLRNDVGDAKLFKDTDGTAYYVYSCLVGGNRHIVLDQLSDDYLTPVAIVSDREVRLEAPVMFKKGDTYYLIASGVNGWDPTQSKYSYTKDLRTGWSEWFNFGDAKTYHSQSACILTIEGSETTNWIYSGDRWESPLSNSSYVWLPIKFNGEKIFIDNVNHFYIDAKTGNVSEQEATQIPSMELGTQNQGGAFPNPFSQSISFQSQNGFYRLFDVTGRELLNGKTTAGLTHLNPSLLNAGTYLLQLTSMESEKSFKIVKR
ncbi:MAG: family 43 glycosylhydrolase [Bacteroidia bacterium]|nr:family 43 glycosylhydrolase [Bacteroidia bacterium]